MTPSPNARVMVKPFYKTRETISEQTTKARLCIQKYARCSYNGAVYYTVVNEVSPQIPNNSLNQVNMQNILKLMINRVR